MQVRQTAVDFIETHTIQENPDNKWNKSEQREWENEHNWANIHEPAFLYFKKARIGLVAEFWNLIQYQALFVSKLTIVKSSCDNTLLLNIFQSLTRKASRGNEVIIKHTKLDISLKSSQARTFSIKYSR